MREWWVYTRCRMMSTRSGMRDQLREHAPDERRILGLFVGLVAVNHELEAPNSVSDGDRDVRPRGIRPDLAVGMAERIIGAVDDEPARRGRGAVERHTHQPAGGAAAAVASDHISRAHGFLPVRELDRDTVVGFRRSSPSAGPHADLDVVESVQPDRTIRRRPSAERSRCAWASRNARREAPFRRAAGAWRRRTAGSGSARCAAGCGRPDRSTGRCAAPRRRARRRAGSR